jgi:hypothetical protein
MWLPKIYLANVGIKSAEMLQIFMYTIEERSKDIINFRHKPYFTLENLKMMKIDFLLLSPFLVV